MKKNAFLFVLTFFSPDQILGTTSITPNTPPAVLASYMESINFDGLIDATFGSNGIVTTNIPPLIQWQIKAAALQTDNKIVVGGDVFKPGLGGHTCSELARYNNDGTLDTTFGTNGTVSTSIFDSCTTTAVLVQPDDKIVAIGLANNGIDNFALIRYNSDGTLDTTFNGTGIATTLIGTQSAAYTGVLQSDGKIIAAGKAAHGAILFALARYNTDGTLDGSFGNNGTVTTPIPGFTVFEENAVLLQTDGKIIAIGYALNGNGYFALIRYNSNGTVDGTFGDNGIVTTHISTFGNCKATAGLLQSDGKIVVLGYANKITDYFAIARYNSDGTVDRTFGTEGIVTTLIPGTNTCQANAGLLQSDDKIIAAGSCSFGLQQYFALTRYTTGGTLDTTFGTNGIVTTSINNLNVIRAALLQQNNSIIAAGRSNNGNDLFTLVRYINPQTLASFTESYGVVGML